MSNRRALCVGVNQYQNFPQSALQGCVNDAHNMQKLLTQFLGFTSGDVTILADVQATKANILSNLRKMVADAKAGKLSHLVFSMSSHGTQIPDTSGDEPDRADEAFCPYDLTEAGNKWDKNHIIVDDELHDLFIQLPKNVLLEVYLDTCHSGTGVRGVDFLLDRRPRFMPPPSLEAFEEVEGKKSRGLNQALQEKGMTHHILWAACRANQTSADARLGGTWNGAFTYYFCKEVTASHNKLSRKEILAKVQADLKAAKFSQSPQLECPATQRTMQLAQSQGAGSGAPSSGQPRQPGTGP